MTETHRHMKTIDTDTIEVAKIDFGNGRYSPLMREAFQDLQRIFGLSEKTSEVVAKRIGADYGGVVSGGFIKLSHTTVGKTRGNDQKVTVKEAATSVKNVHLTNGLIALRAINFANEATKHDLAPLRGIKADGELAKWFAELENE